jgi:hypothetical protein
MCVSTTKIKKAAPNSSKIRPIITLLNLLFVEATLTELRLAGLDQSNNILDRPQLVRDPRRHCWRQLVGLVQLHEVILHEIERERVAVVVEFLGESVGQSREAPHLHAHRKIVPLGKRRGCVLRVRCSTNPLVARADDFRGSVAALG